MFLENTLNHFILILSVAAISILFTLIHYFFFKNKGPWGRLWTFFVVIWLFDWVMGLWYFLIVDNAEAIPWLLLIFIAFVTTLLIAASTSQSRERQYRTYDENTRVVVRENTTSETPLANNYRFWILLGFLSLSLIAGYIKIFFP